MNKNRRHHAHRHNGRMPKTGERSFASQHGFVGLRLDTTGRAIDQFDQDAMRGATDFLRLLNLDPELDRPWATSTGLAQPASLVAGARTMLRQLITAEHDRILLPDDPTAPAALVLAHCEHVRAEAARQYQAETPELTFQMAAHPTAWLLLVIAPGKATA